MGMNPLKICNMALGFFGQGRIASIEDDQITSDEASLCNLYYEPSYLATLEDGAWLFATEFLDLGAREDSPYMTLGVGTGLEVSPRPLLAQFTMPGTLVRPLACDDGGGDFSILWERNKRKILSEDTDRLFCRGIVRMDDPNEWPMNFAMTVGYKLASIIAGPITHSAKIEAEMMQKYAEGLKTSGTLDGLQGTTQQRFRPNSEGLAKRRA